ncbi:MAG: serine protease [Chloroflexi bacterium]|nr:MAG: serine protease [Chloroflexota bacterium]
MSGLSARALTIFALLASLVMTASSSTSVYADPPDKSKLDKHSRELVATASVNGNASVTLLIAAAEGATGSVISALQAIGGDVRRSDAEFGYIRVDIAADRADQASKIAGVLAADVDEIIPLELPKPELAESPDAVPAPPDSTTPAQNAYMPTQDIGAPQFVAAHPTWDGRGVVIGQLDTGVDLDHPALQTTTTGQRKIIDWVTFTDPLTDNDPTWIVMDKTVTSVGGTFTVGTGASAKTYTGAPDGTWKFGIFNESDPRFGGPGSEFAIGCGGDLNRNGLCGDKFAILWDGTDNVWVDSNADQSFADEHVMQPYKVKYDVGEFGRDKPATAVKESVPFVVQVDASTNTVNIGIASGEHATHVASIMTGNGLYKDGSNPGFNGAAPGAQLVSIRVCLFVVGCTAHALIEGMIYAEKVANVDTINMSIGGLPALNDGNNARAILYNSLIEKKGAQMFISAGNSGPGVNTVADPSVATAVMSVGAYWTRESAFANYGAAVSTAEALHDFSSRGPREDGGFKPDIVAPGNAVGAIPQWQGQQCVPYSCRVGYGLLNGTSMAAPQATGASALLLSASKGGTDVHSNDKKFRPAELRQAMRSSARFISGYSAHEQGFGLIDVGRAWDLLSSNVKTSSLTSAVETHTLLSSFLAKPGIGTGIYDREGVTVGDAPYIRTYTFSGDSGTFRLSWIGNDGTFSLPAGMTSITTSKKGKTLAIRVTPTTVGAHSAILVLDDPNTAGIDFATMNTVIVAQPLNAANGYTATLTGSANKFEDSRPNFFFQVPVGTTALRVTMEGLTGRSKFVRIHPYGVPIDPSSTAFQTAPYTAPRTTQVSPLPGTWEIGTEASRTTLVDPATFKVTATAYRVDFSPASWTQDPATVGTTYNQSLTATNVYATATIATNGSPFASAFTAAESIASGGAHQLVNINVPARSTNVTATIGGASDPAADLDLFLFDCHTGACTLAGSSTSSSSNETVSVNNPASGLWISLVDPFAVPSGNTSYTYTDSIANPAYGSINAATSAAAMTSGATRAVNASARADSTANIVPSAGRVLRGAINARLDLFVGSVVGSAAVTFVTNP